MFVDLLSDTVTRPTPAMLDAMLNAGVGDDVFDEDPTVNKLQNKIAKMFGKEAALFCPSGTMTNQIAIKVHTQPGDEVICHRLSHVYNYEGGGMAFNSGASVRLIEGNRGIIKAESVEENVNPLDSHFARTAVLSIENTVNKGGGSIYFLLDVEPLYNQVKKFNLKFHLDGARLFNALVETGESSAEWGKYFDSISICFSKGLGAPVGSVIIGDKEFIDKAHRVRKVFGGGMRQAGILAAACIYALDNNIERLKDDHKRARILSDAVARLTFVEEVLPVETNIVIFTLNKKITSDRFVKELLKKEIRCAPFGKYSVRMVTHLDVNDDMIEETERILKTLQF